MKPRSAGHLHVGRLKVFAIRVLPVEQADIDGVRLGEIIVNDFTEQFACHPVDGSIEKLESYWRTELHKLLGGSKSVALVRDPRFAWIFYRDHDSCYVQDVLSLDGDFTRHLASRRTHTDDGNRISEWKTNVSAIALFLRS